MVKIGCTWNFTPCDYSCIERDKIGNDDEDRENFTTKMGELAQETEIIIYKL